VLACEKPVSNVYCIQVCGWKFEDLIFIGTPLERQPKSARLPEISDPKPKN